MTKATEVAEETKATGPIFSIHVFNDRTTIEQSKGSKVSLDDVVMKPMQLYAHSLLQSYMKNVEDKFKKDKKEPTEEEKVTINDTIIKHTYLKLKELTLAVVQQVTVAQTQMPFDELDFTLEMNKFETESINKFIEAKKESDKKVSAPVKDDGKKESK